MKSNKTAEHHLEFLDQTALELLKATGRNQLIQCAWIYEHPVDEAGLERFHRNFYASIAGRVIEPSPLPFGRPRWVRPGGEIPPIQRGAGTRPRSEVQDWLNELGDLPIDPVRGPASYLAVQSFDDGATGVCIVASHVLGDGAGGMMAIFEAVTGNIRNLGYETRGDRTRRKALLTDFRQVLRDLPLTARTAVLAAKMLRAKRDDFSRARAAHAADTAGKQVVVPSAGIFIDTGQWDARAAALGGNSYSLLAGFAAKLAEYLDRRRASDGMVSLLIAINERDSLEDDRAIAMAFASATVDPAKVAIDLTEARNAVRAAREKAKSEPDPTRELLPLIPFLPQNAVKGVADLMFSYSEDLPVSCSNLGDLPSELACADGTPAEYVIVRALDTNVTEGELERSHGQLVVVSGRINGTISISVEAYQLGAENTKERLRDLVGRTLTDFGLTGVVE